MFTDNENLKLQFINILSSQNTRPLNSKIWRERILVSKDLSLILKINMLFLKRSFIRKRNCGVVDAKAI